MARILRLSRDVIAAALTLQKGIWVLKYREGGTHAPHRRYVWFSADMKHVQWAPFGRHAESALTQRALSSTIEQLPTMPLAEATPKAIPVSSISAISIGAKTRTELIRRGVLVRIVQK